MVGRCYRWRDRWVSMMNPISGLGFEPERVHRCLRQSRERARSQPVGLHHEVLLTCPGKKASGPAIRARHPVGTGAISPPAPT